MKREIIIGYDPEHRGEDSLRLGERLAGILVAHPLVFSALPWPHYLMGLTDLDNQLELEMKDDFARIHERLGPLGVETRAAAGGNAAAALHEVAEGELAQLIVLGSSHRSPAGRTLAGSVGESLMSGAPCALAIAPRGYAERDWAGIQRIGVAFDGSSESWAALETAIAIAERCRARVTVVTVADYPQYGYATAWSVLSTGEIRDFEREEKQRLLELAQSRVPGALSADGRLLIGDAGALLVEASGDLDLMIAGSRAYGPLRRTLLGSTTRKLIRSASCPVIVLPRGAGMDPLRLGQVEVEQPRPAALTTG